MKIIITASGNQIEHPFNPRFGRADFFILIDSETRDWKALANPAAEARGGAGPQAVQFLVRQGAQAVISGSFGPNAYAALEAAGIAAYVASEGSVAEVLQQFLDGQLEQVSAATGPERHGGH